MRLSTSELIKDARTKAMGMEFSQRWIVLEMANRLEMLMSVDAVPVVRCKDCKHFGGHGACHYHAADENGTPIFVRDDDFCSYGERRTTDESL